MVMLVMVISLARLSEETKEKMIEMRKSGYTYLQIENKLGVSRWSTMKYLGDMNFTDPPSDEWLKREKETVEYLEVHGFENIIDLNEVANTNSAWDFFFFLDGKKYLIDTTINDQKPIRGKLDVLPENHIAIILYYDRKKEQFIPFVLQQVIL